MTKNGIGESDSFSCLIPLRADEDAEMEAESHTDIDGGRTSTSELTRVTVMGAPLPRFVWQ